MKPKYLPILFLIVLYACSQGHSDSGWQPYEVGAIPDLEEFMRPNQSEKGYDSIYGHLNPQLQELKAELTQKLKDQKDKDSIELYEAALEQTDLDFASNRARVYITNLENGKEKQQPSPDGVPTLCSCELRGDTIVSRAALGLFGGITFTTSWQHGSFLSETYLYADDAQIYKQLPDSAFSNSLRLTNNSAKLTLDHEPSMKKGQQLTGYLQFSTPDYHEKKSPSETVTASMKVKIYFSCKVKKGLPRGF